MGSSGRWVDRSVLLLAVVVAVALVLAASTSTVAFSPYNGNWEGVSGLQRVAANAGAETDVSLETAAYERTVPGNTVAVVVSPDRRYSTAEAATVEQFVRSGGTLLVAEDFGPHSNALLSAIGASSRLDGRLLVDERSYYRSPTMPVASPEPDAASDVLAGVDSFTINHGTAIEPNGARILVESSEFATLRTESGTIVSTTVGPYPLVTIESLGEGSVVVVADSSALINVMLDRPGNAALMENLFAPYDHVLLDNSHRENVPPVERALEALETSPLLGVVVVLFTIVGTGLATARLTRGRSESSIRPRSAQSSVDAAVPFRTLRRLSSVGGLRRSGGGDPGRTEGETAVDEAALVSYLRSRHPEWDPSRAERVARAIGEAARASASDRRT